MSCGTILEAAVAPSICSPFSQHRRTQLLAPDSHARPRSSQSSQHFRILRTCLRALAVVLLPVVPSCGTLPYCERPSTRPQQHGARPTECVTTTHRIATTDARSISHVVEAVLRLRHLTSGAHRFALATAVACGLRRRSSATGIHSR
jgi:hypothetical protein